jgi:hypothetical protein
MNIHTFLFDLIKLLVTISIGILTLALAFADKLNLDFTNKKTRNSLAFLWFSFISSLILYILSGFFIFSDFTFSTVEDAPVLTATTKTFILLTLVPFILMLVALTQIGVGIIKQKKAGEDINQEKTK